MARKIDLITSVTIEKTEKGVLIKSDRGFYWYANRMLPEVAMTAVLGNQLSHTLEYEDYFSGEFTIELIIKHKYDE